jgi:seryl-tRNA synthetase
MIDIRLFRDDLDGLARALGRRGVPRAELERIRDLDERRRALITSGDELRARQKQLGREVGGAGSDEERQRLIGEVKQVSTTLDQLGPEQAEIEADLQAALDALPNLPHPEPLTGRRTRTPSSGRRSARSRRSTSPSATTSTSATRSACSTWRAARRCPAAASRTSRGRRSSSSSPSSATPWMCCSWAKGFTPMLPPVLTRAEALYGTGFLPGSEEQLYKVPEDDLYLVGTSEVPLAAYHGDEILAGDDLPIRYAGFSTNFRREAGTYGKDTRGIFRVHQFDKVEMFVFCRPEDAEAEHERLRDTQVELLSGLGLHGRVVDIPVGDLGASAARKYDCEVWLPGQEAYRELTSRRTAPTTRRAGCHPLPRPPRGRTPSRSHPQRDRVRPRADDHRGPRDPPAGRRDRRRARGAAGAPRHRSDRVRGATTGEAR